MIRYRARAIPVQKSFSLKPTFRSGGLTSGVNLDRGLNKPRNLPAMWFVSP